MKPRSSSPLISRWMPDFDLSDSASFISSKEGETPTSVEPPIDEHQQFVLLSGQHGALTWPLSEQNNNDTIVLV